MRIINVTQTGVTSPLIPRVPGSQQNAASPQTDFGAYLFECQKRIRRHFHVAKSAEVGHADAVVLFSIKEDGGLSKVALHKSSGDDAYDRAALNAIEAAAPFAPPPAAKQEILFTFGGWLLAH